VADSKQHACPRHMLTMPNLVTVRTVRVSLGAPNMCAVLVSDEALRSDLIHMLNMDVEGFSDRYRNF